MSNLNSIFNLNPPLLCNLTHSQALELGSEHVGEGTVTSQAGAPLPHHISKTAQMHQKLLCLGEWTFSVIELGHRVHHTLPTE